jgi:spore maturation protein A
MTPVLVCIYLLSFFAALLLGHTAEAGLALLEGTRDALLFAPELGAALCLWSALLELLERSGASGALAGLLRSPLKSLFPRGARDGEILQALSENLGANILGLGNAATPAGIRAARGLAALGARAELNTLAVLNTASVQLLPTTAASLRASLGSASPFDITPAVWVSSALSLAAGLTAIRLFNRR